MIKVDLKLLCHDLKKTSSACCTAIIHRKIADETIFT